MASFRGKKICSTHANPSRLWEPEEGCAYSVQKMKVTRLRKPDELTDRLPARTADTSTRLGDILKFENTTDTAAF
jgi:hypothetical protein